MLVIAIFAEGRRTNHTKNRDDQRQPKQCADAELKAPHVLIIANQLALRPARVLLPRRQFQPDNARHDQGDAGQSGRRCRFGKQKSL
ncbi:MAG TPA: hypothetical protein VHC19_10425, partial [Pirellulales bacterium]|nr:hypothetical protein [Pirellulales bacterium]